MLNKLHNRPLWYQVWAITVGVGAFYLVFITLYAIFAAHSVNTALTDFDYLLMVYVNGSVCLDLYLFPKRSN